MIVISQREPLNVYVKRLPQIVHHPLAYAGGQQLLGIAAQRSDDGDDDHRNGGELQYRELIAASQILDQKVQPAAGNLL